MRQLLNYSYPGNVRELENILEHALIICRGDLIEARHLPDYLQAQPTERPKTPPERRHEPQQVETGEAERLLKVLRKYGWHRGRAAAELGIDRTTLWRKIKKYDLHPA